MFEILSKLFEISNGIFEILIEMSEILTKLIRISKNIFEISNKMFDITTEMFEISSKINVDSDWKSLSILTQFQKIIEDCDRTSKISSKIFETLTDIVDILSALAELEEKPANVVLVD